MTELERIQALTIEDCFVLLLGRIIDITGVPHNEPLYVLDLDESKTFYERVILHSSLIKPSLQLFSDELIEYKGELTDAENARLAEVARIEDIKTRFNAISDIRGAIGKAGLSIQNPAKELERIIEENDQDRLSAIELAWTAFQSEDLVENQQDEVADKLINICHGCIKIMMKHNLKNGLSAAQKDQQAVDYASAMNALNSWRPGKFKSEITALTPDGTLVKQDLKDELLAYLTGNGI